jgi:hypothetical protein
VEQVSQDNQVLKVVKVAMEKLIQSQTVQLLFIMLVVVEVANMIQVDMY